MSSNRFTEINSGQNPKTTAWCDHVRRRQGKGEAANLRKKEKKGEAAKGKRRKSKY
jgi:hypothetical protein